jgi:hypothetical protein
MLEPRMFVLLERLACVMVNRPRKHVQFLIKERRQISSYSNPHESCLQVFFGVSRQLRYPGIFNAIHPKFLQYIRSPGGSSPKQAVSQARIQWASTG